MKESLIVKILTRIFDLILLNVLWVACSVPIVTFGAATAALYSVTLKMVANEEGHITRDFFKGFKNNFKQSTLIWLGLLILNVFFVLDWQIIRELGGLAGTVGKIAVGIGFVVCIIELIYVFPLIARFENKTLQIIKNALLIPLARFPYAVLIFFMSVMCATLTLMNQMTIMAGAVVWTLFGGALLAFAESYLFRKMFAPFED